MKNSLIKEIQEILKIAGVKIDEEYIYSSKDMKSCILKNPSQNEIKKTGINYWRIIQDDNNNYYFGDAYSFIHQDIVEIVSNKLNADFTYTGTYNFGFGVLLYEYKTNTFFYRADIYDKKDYKISLENAKKIINNNYFKSNFTNFKIKISSEEEPWNDFNQNNIY